MDMILNIFKETAYFFNEVAIYLAFGFLMAGLLHVIFPENLIFRHIGKNNFMSVFKASLFGIPLLTEGKDEVLLRFPLNSEYHLDVKSNI